MGIKSMYKVLSKVTIIQIIKGLISFIAGFVIANLSSKLLNSAMDGEKSVLLETSIMLIIFILSYEGINFLIEMYSERLKTLKGQSLRVNVYEKFYNMPIEEIQNIDGGQVKEVIGDDLNNIEKFITSLLPSIITGVLITVGYLAYTCSKSYFCAFIILLFGLIQIVPPVIVRKYLEKSYDNTRDINCDKIEGGVECRGDLSCTIIDGNVICNGDISYR